MRAAWLPLLALLATTFSVMAQWNPVQHNGRRHVPLEDVARFYKLNQQVSSGKSFNLTAPGRTLTGKVGTREVYINNVKYILCFPISTGKNGQILMSAMDVTKIIEPVLRPSKIQNATAVKTVVLDAGHGGHDSGASGPFGLEKNYTLDVANRAKALLEAAGYTVKMTRSKDVFIPLEERARIANRHRNAIFVSIHFNKSKTTGGTGIETFCLAPRGVPSMDEETVTISNLKHHPGNARDAENIMLATAMHASLLKNCRIFDRGIKRARFVVVKDATIPAVLIEGGFLNHPQDARLIASSNYRQQMARAILDGVNAYQKATQGILEQVPPTLVVSAAPSVPDEPHEEPPAPVGSKTSLEPAVAQAQVILENNPASATP